ncbi:tail fiber domain-containing protein [Vagococcus fluvialis]|uniref:tail fiber domain-containing protein n=1 Tax=Vagococcus fluvialis TaxID=2738 RepID=UPI00288FB336|nr:tail fiber domain-containing protein [Vagococcus fluvialis]MDT2782898.1 tail fiber domain-containing protein [Vagococcus fluvialis]
MLAVSNAFNEAFKSDLREVKMRIKINDVTYTDEDIISFNFNSGSIVGETFAIGSTYANSIKLTLCKIVEGLKQLDEVTPEMGIVLPNGSTEWVKLGTFIISEEVNPDRNENRTSLECTDKMIMLDEIYESKLKYPARIRAVALEIANLAGVEVEPVSFGRLMENTIQKPVGYTYRQALGLIAQFEAGYVCFDRNGLLAIKQLEDKDYQVTPNEYFLKGLIKNELMFKPAGIQVKVSSDTEEDKVLKIGNEKGSVIHLENKVMTDGLLRLVYDKVKNINYYPYTLKWRGNPAVEVGDWLQVTDTKGNLFKVPNLSYSFEYNGGLTATSTVETVASNEVRFGYKGILDQTVEYVENALKDVGGNLIYYGVEAPPSPKEGDTWFKYVDSDTEIWVYEKISEPDVFDWVFKISSAVDGTIKEKIEQLEEDSKQQQLDIEKALTESELARKEAFDSTVISRQAERDALNALAQGDKNKTEITKLDGQQKLTNTKVEGNTANMLNLQADSEKLSLSIGKVQADVDGMEIGGRNYFSQEKLTNGKLESWIVPSYLFHFELQPNTEYTVSSNVPGYVGDTSKTNIYFNGSISAGDGVWLNKPVTKKSDNDGYLFIAVPANRIHTDEILNGIYWIQLEKGNKATDWSPDSEDLTSKSEFATFEANYKGFQTDVKSDLTGLHSQQTQMSGQISSVVEKVDNLSDNARNYWSISSIVGNFFIDTNGKKIPYPNYFLVERLIKIKPSDELIVQFWNDKEQSYADAEGLINFYDSDQKYIGRSTPLLLTTDKYKFYKVKPPINSAYFNVSMPARKVRIKIEKNTAPSIWSPAPEDNASKSEVIQLSDQLNLRVEKANVIAQINLSHEQVLIQAKRIHLSGESLIDDAVIKTAHIDNLAVTGAKIQDATISTAKIISLDADKINASTLSAITSNTGTLNVTGWMNILTENNGLRGTFDYGDAPNVYNPRWFNGDFQLAKRMLIFQGDIYKLNANGTKGAYDYSTGSIYGLDHFKFRTYNSRNASDSNLRSRIDITSDKIEISNNFNPDAIRAFIRSDGSSYFENVSTGIINAGVYYNTLKLNTEWRRNLGTITLTSSENGVWINDNTSVGNAQMMFGRDAAGARIYSMDLYNRTYSGNAEVIITPAGTLGRRTSARKYKADIITSESVIKNAKKVLELKPVSWLDKAELDRGEATSRYHGFIADEFEEVGLSEVVIYNEQREVEGLAYDRISMYHNVILSEHEKEIEKLKQKIELLEDRLYA